MARKNFQRINEGRIARAQLDRTHFNPLDDLVETHRIKPYRPVIEIPEKVGAGAYGVSGLVVFLAALAIAGSGCDKKQSNGYEKPDKKPRIEIYDERTVRTIEEERVFQELSSIDEYGTYGEELPSLVKSKEFRQTYEYLTRDVKIDTDVAFNISALGTISKLGGRDLVKYLVEEVGLEVERAIQFPGQPRNVYSSNLPEIEDLLTSEEKRTKLTSEETRKFFNYLKDNVGKKDWKPEQLDRLLDLDLSKASDLLQYLVDELGYDLKPVGTEYMLDLFSAAQDKEFMRKVKDPKYHSHSDIFSTNDIGLIDLIESNEDLKAIYQDRTRLIGELQGIYEREPALRTMRGGQKTPDSYSERPPLEEFGTLDLMRIYLVNQALQNPENLKELGKIIEKDIFEVKGGELGGISQYHDGGLKFDLRLSRVNTTTDSKFINELGNGSYSVGSFNHFNHGSITTFHLHALSEDCSDGAGPSLGDIWVSSAYRSTGVVITTLGEAGEGKLKIGLDLYVGPRTKGTLPDYDKTILDGAKVMDLGTYIVPFNKPKKVEK